MHRQNILELETALKDVEFKIGIPHVSSATMPSPSSSPSLSTNTISQINPSFLEQLYQKHQEIFVPTSDQSSRQKQLTDLITSIIGAAGAITSTATAEPPASGTEPSTKRERDAATPSDADGENKQKEPRKE
eukprot:10859780-Karenia_brevis.AAC.1